MIRAKIANNRTLQLDLDGQDKLADARRRYAVFKSILRHRSPELHFRWSQKESRTPGHWHALIRSGQPLSPALRVALQACLGSDPIREMHNAARVLSGSRNPILFFERS